MAFHSIHRRAAAWGLTLSCVAAAASAAPTAATPDVSGLFGGRVRINSMFRTTVLKGDFDGDGVTDTAWLVMVLPTSAVNRIAPDVIVSATFGKKPLGAGATKLALAIALGGARPKFLLASTPGSDDFLNTPIWGAAPPPISVAKRGGASFRQFHAQNKAIKNDFLVLGSESGADTALYWNGKGFAWIWSNEEP